MTLLNPDFYDAELKPILAQWLLLFFKGQHLIGLSDADTTRYLVRRPTLKDEPEFVKRVEALDGDHMKLLNLGYDWLSCFLPHIMQKIDRVSFGIMNGDDMKRARDDHPNMPRSRFVTAIPFVGKDMPSQSSEFAHPDIVMGLSILAYRYEGLRESDFNDIMRELHAAVDKEVGRFSQRKTNVMYNKWVAASGGKLLASYDYKDKKPVQDADADLGMQPSESIVFSNDNLLDDNDDHAAGMEPSHSGNAVALRKRDVLPLKLMKQANKQESDKLFALFRRTPEVIHFYLCESVFPEFMRHQQTKLSASGQELGGDMIFKRRVAFSGTPSDLLPKELGSCEYEKGTDGQLITTLTSPNVVSYAVVPQGWTVRGLLDNIATATNPPFHALIDTGALITGMSNLQVAQYLLKHGLTDMEGVVFLDELDRKMILVRATGRVLKLAECGIPKVKRFAFYDQVHTTGMDIEHCPNAKAVQTLGKDMTFRDFSQGAYRMRGIGLGQTVSLLIIPEVYDLIMRTLSGIRKSAIPPLRERQHIDVLRDVTAWLLVNSIKSEHVQHNQLCLQSCANVWRKEAFQTICSNVASFKIGTKPSEEALHALSVFREAVSFSVVAGVPQPRMFSESVVDFVEKHRRILDRSSDAAKAILSGIIEGAKKEDEIENPVVDVQMVQEQEEERESEQEQTKEQEVEVEKFVDLAYSREEERPTPWKLDTLADPTRAAQFYHLKDFRLYKRRSLSFPESIMLSRNYYDPRWAGHRRMKNVIVTLEWIPDSKYLTVRPQPSEDFVAVEDSIARKALQHTLKLVKGHQGDNFSDAVLHDLVQTALSCESTDDEWANILTPFRQANGELVVNFDDVFLNLLRSNVLRNEESGRYTVAVTLAEAETLRRVIHLRQFSPSFLAGHAGASIALRAVPSANAMIDASCGFKHPSTAFQVTRNYLSLRFFDGDLHYNDVELALLLRCVHGNAQKMRQAFFQQVMSCRRRARQRWETTPIQQVFSMATGFTLLQQRVVGLLLKKELEARELNVGDAYVAFNNSHSGMLSPDEVWGAMAWCRLKLTAEDVLDFISAVDTHREDTIHFGDFVCALTGSRELDESSDTNAEDGQGKKLPTVEPIGAEELKQVKGERMRLLREQEAEANREMESENLRVIEEIEAEQIALDMKSISDSGNPMLEDTALTFTLDNDAMPSLISGTGAGRVYRVKTDPIIGVHARMHGSCGLRANLRLLKRVAKGGLVLPKFALTIECRLPKPSSGDQKTSLLRHFEQLRKPLTLARWTLPILRFSGYSTTGTPSFEIDVFGVSNIVAVANQNLDAFFSMNAKKRKDDNSNVFGNFGSSRGTGPGQGGAAAGKDVVELLHVLADPRPAKVKADSVSELAVGDFVITDGKKMTTSNDGMTYEWMHVTFPADGWVVRERNGKSMWESVVSSISFTEKGFALDQSAFISTGADVVSPFEDGLPDLSNLAGGDDDDEDGKQKAKSILEEEEDETCVVGLNNDVGDLMEALRRLKRLKSGDKVTRNPETWDHDNDDGGSGTIGRVLRVENDMAHVQWPGGNKGEYSWGSNGKFELIKVADGDDDEEGDERETMNDDRWLSDLRKGGAKCNACNSSNLTPANWYRCNHCDPLFNLCRKCFRQGNHTEHDFTDMSMIGQGAANEIAQGVYVKIKLSVTNPKFGWENAKPGSVGVVIDVDRDEGTVTIELVEGGSEWRGDLMEVEVTEAPKEEKVEDTQTLDVRYAFLPAVESMVTPQARKWPFLSAASEYARNAVTPKFKVGDKVKHNKGSTAPKYLDGETLRGEIRAVNIAARTYDCFFDDRGFESNIVEARLQPLAVKKGDRVKLKESAYKNSSLPENERSRASGTIDEVDQCSSYCNGQLSATVVWDNTLRERFNDEDLEVSGTGKWAMHPKEGEEGKPFPLQASSNLIVERAFTDGQPTIEVFIRDDTYIADIENGVVKRGEKVIGKLLRDPPAPFVLGELKKQLDDGFPHVVTLYVDNGEILLVVDGKVMPMSATGVLHAVKDINARRRLVQTALSFDITTPLTLMHADVSADMLRATSQFLGHDFPVRTFTWIRFDWDPNLRPEEVAALHASIDASTLWDCRGCSTANSRLVDICVKCKEPRFPKKGKTEAVQGKFRASMPKSQDAQMVRQKIQNRLRAQYQRELDTAEEAANARAAAAGKKKGAEGPAAAPPKI